MGIVEAECDEALYWMQMPIEAGIVKRSRLTELMGEANEIIAIVVRSIKTARARSEFPKSVFEIRNELHHHHRPGSARSAQDALQNVLRFSS
jgi:hypothetical protein